MLIVGLDDTDTLETRGTGHLAREIAAALAVDYPVLGVVRHQLLRDPRVPCTKNNSCAALLVEAAGARQAERVFQRVRAMMVAEFVPGSDPGLCVADDVPPEIVAFGHRTQSALVQQAEAWELAARHELRLTGLGGTEGGVIGALAAVGLAASGEDGRYVLVGRVRELSGLQPVSALLEAGIVAVRTMSGEAVGSGRVDTERLRPARRGGQPVAYVAWDGDRWLPQKLD